MRGKVFAAGLAGFLAFFAGSLSAPAALTNSPSPDLLAQYRPAHGPAPMTPSDRGKLDLGWTLFFDPILSANSTQSCATCHNPGLSWGAGLPRSIGNAANIMGLRSPTLLDIGDLPRLGWDGKFASIEAVTFAAISGPANMNLPVPAALARLRAMPAYVAAFDRAFPGRGITRETVEEAVGAYERSIVSGPSPFDRWVAGERRAIGADAQRGFALFNGAGQCAKCHSGWAFTDGSFHDIGTASGTDIGRGALFPTSRKLKYAFKTPTLRDVARRGPYMHDGAVPDLRAVVDLYDRGGIDRPSRSELIRPLHLSAADKTDIIAFLQTLTSDPRPVPVPVLPR